MSIPILDQKGNTIPGLSRDHNGAIKVLDSSRYKYYQNQKLVFDRLNEQENKINDINMKLDYILTLLKDTHRRPS